MCTKTLPTWNRDPLLHSLPVNYPLTGSQKTIRLFISLYSLQRTLPENIKSPEDILYYFFPTLLIFSVIPLCKTVFTPVCRHPSQDQQTEDKNKERSSFFIKKDSQPETEDKILHIEMPGVRRREASRQQKYMRECRGQ